MLNMEQAADMEADEIQEDLNYEMVFHECKDKTVNALIREISDRAVKSNLKHGNTIDQVDKSIPEWVQEAKEEAIDMAVYVQQLAVIMETAKALLIDLGWESQRMSSSGVESLMELYKLFKIETDEELENG
mgnify:CR=1 FL=1|tara:strand:- start:110 stop:502 length:393 start_codon:yes stop_codon:yes gene_type:complete